jgi:hypothetical protein
MTEVHIFFLMFAALLPLGQSLVNDTHEVLEQEHLDKLFINCDVSGVIKNLQLKIPPY